MPRAAELLPARGEEAAPSAETHRGRAPALPPAACPLTSRLCFATGLPSPLPWQWWSPGWEHLGKASQPLRSMATGCPKAWNQKKPPGHGSAHAAGSLSRSRAVEQPLPEREQPRGAGPGPGLRAAGEVSPAPAVPTRGCGGERWRGSSHLRRPRPPSATFCWGQGEVLSSAFASRGFLFHLWQKQRKQKAEEIKKHPFLQNENLAKCPDAQARQKLSLEPAGVPSAPLPASQLMGVQGCHGSRAPPQPRGQE